MIPRLLLGPNGVLPSLWHTTANPPSNHWQSSVEEIFPPGPIGLGFISPSVVHFPTKYPRRLCSGPGDCGPGGCWAATTENPTDTTTQSARSVGILFVWLPPLGAQTLPGERRKDK